MPLLLEPPPYLTPAADAARVDALNILTPDEQALVEVLNSMRKDNHMVGNARHRPRPDRATTLNCIEEASISQDNLRTLKDFLATNPTRIPGWHEPESFDGHELLLFAPDGSYCNAATHRKKVEVLKKELEVARDRKQRFEEAIARSTLMS